jgi:hypothetical protein
MPFFVVVIVVALEQIISRDERITNNGASMEMRSK